MGRRIRWLGMVLVVCFAAVIVQLVNVQLRQASALNSSSTNPRNAVKRFNNFRGAILAADGTTVLAKSVPVPHPKAGTYRYYRTYPGGSLYSGIVGYDSTYYGTAGVENVYNTQLSLHAQKAKTLGQLLSPPPPAADAVTLTIQPTLQQASAQALASIPGPRKDGAIVVMNPKTGAILSMYSSPSFNPNALAQPTVAAEQQAHKADFTAPDSEGFYPGEPMATFDRFLPGSTYKVVTTTAVYNLKPTLSGYTWGPGKCTKIGTIPGTTKTVCNDASTKTNASTCGGTLRQMLPESCDPGYVLLGLAVGATAMYKQANLFGVNSVPPVDLTDVSKSHYPTPAQLTTGSTGPGRPGLAYSAFGQGTVSLTALQNAMNVATIANTGAEMTPHVMSQVRNAQGGLVQQYKPTVYKQAASSSAAQKVKTLMELVASTPNGTAYGIFPATEQVAAKTGTAQVGTPATLTVDWMVAFAPATDPTVAVAVVTPYEPKTAYGATYAGPIAQKMIAAALAEERAHGLVPTTTPTAPPPPIPTTTTTTTTSPTTKSGVVPSAPPAPTTTTTTSPPAPTTTTTTSPPAPTTTTTTSPLGSGVTASKTTRPAGTARPPGPVGASP